MRKRQIDTLHTNLTCKLVCCAALRSRHRQLKYNKVSGIISTHKNEQLNRKIQLKNIILAVFI